MLNIDAGGVQARKILDRIMAQEQTAGGAPGGAAVSAPTGA